MCLLMFVLRVGIPRIRSLLLATVTSQELTKSVKISWKWTKTQRRWWLKLSSESGSARKSLQQRRKLEKLEMKTSKAKMGWNCRRRRLKTK